MNFRKVKEEFVVVFCQDEAGATLKIAIRQHLVACPSCRKQADQARRIIAIVQQRCTRHCAPQDLRSRILACLPHRCAEKDGGS